jgi:hypothetical protein
MKARSFAVPFVLLFLGLAACGGGGDDAPDHPGDQDFTPPPTDDGTGMPPGATSFTCDVGEDCDFWFCQCADGAVVNSAFCVNGYCMDAASACPDACAFFDHGNWTGAAGGGPGTSQPLECGGLGSDTPSCDDCFHDQCCDQGETCGESQACLDYWDCAVACGGDPDCRAECDVLYPDGADAYGELEACVVGECSAACGGS